VKSQAAMPGMLFLGFLGTLLVLHVSAQPGKCCSASSVPTAPLYCSGFLPGSTCYACTGGSGDGGSTNNHLLIEGLCSGHKPNACPSTGGYCVSGTVSGGSIIHDPHFTGFDGRKFDFQGEPNQVFALISESYVQVNSRFMSSVYAGETNMGDICVRFCDDTVTIDRFGRVAVSTFTNPDLVVTVSKSNPDSARQTALVHITAGLWSMEVILDHPPNNTGFSFLDLENITLNYPPLAGQIHGVLGATVPSIDGDMPLTPTNCSKDPNEGGCAIEGNWKDYEIAENELCGTSFKFSRFDSERCAAHASKKRGHRTTLLALAAGHLL